MPTSITVAPVVGDDVAKLARFAKSGDRPRLSKSLDVRSHAVQQHAKCHNERVHFWKQWWVLQQ